MPTHHGCRCSWSSIVKLPRLFWTMHYSSICLSSVCITALFLAPLENYWSNKVLWTHKHHAHMVTLLTTWPMANSVIAAAEEEEEEAGKGQTENKDREAGK